MDLGALVKIRDGVCDNKRPTNVSGYKVKKREGTILDDAISRNNTINNKLKIKDRNNAVRYKTSRIESLSKQQPTVSKTKYIVLDSRAINEIADMPNTQKRNFLAHLSDSDRRRVLRAIKVKDDLDDGQLKRRDLNRELEPQDLYVINDLLTKFAYSRKDDELRMLESYKDLLDETDGQELAVLTLINKVIDGDLDLNEDADIVNDVYNFFEDNGFETDSLDASLNAAFGDTNAEQVETEDEGLDLNEDEGLDADLNNEDLGDEDLNNEDTNLDLNTEDEAAEEDDLTLDLNDSAKNKKQIVNNKIADAKTRKVAKARFEDIEANIIDDSYNLAMKVLKNETTNIADSTAEIINKYVDLTNEPVRVKDTFDRAFSCSLGKISNFLYSNVQKVKDDIIEQIDERLGEDSTDAEGKTLLESLGAALEAFANGDNTLLESLSELTLDDVQPEEDFNIEEDENSENDENAENEEEEENDVEGEDDLTLNLGDSVVNLAKALLANDKKANVYIDKLKDSVEILRKINFKITDDALINEDEEYLQSEVDVIEPILTREEFQSTYDYPLYVGEMAKEANPTCCVSAPTAVNYGETNPIIQVEHNGVYQNWMPITGSNAKIVEQLEQDGVDVAKTISDNCVPVEDYYIAAAKTNNLGLIDNKFYKRKLSDNSWICEGIADCVADCEGITEDATFVQSGLTTMPKMVPSGSVLIYGTKYDYYNKMQER